MPSWKTFRCVTDVLGDHLADDAVVEAVQVSADLSTITLWTSTPGVVIGRRGAVAQRISDALKDSLGIQVRLLVQELDDPPDDDPFGAAGEPRSPIPDAASGGVHIVESRSDK
jgi:hypothetical protein